nr:hypothetical protein BaRGS_003744 [Batillaria attramentaria]
MCSIETYVVFSHSTMLLSIGYHLVIVKATDCKVSKVTRVIRKAVAGATFQKEIQTELFYLMPEKQVSRFVALFKDLEARKEELGILSFGANGTTMEDVFLSARCQRPYWPSGSIQEAAGTSSSGYSFLVNTSAHTWHWYGLTPV